MTIGQISPGRFDQMGGTVTAVTLVLSTESNAAESDNCDAGRPLACQRCLARRPRGVLGVGPRRPHLDCCCRRWPRPGKIKTRGRLRLCHNLKRPQVVIIEDLAEPITERGCARAHFAARSVRT